MPSNKHRLLIVVLIILAAIAGFWLRGYITVGSCLDSGGRWNRDWKICERYVEPGSVIPTQ